MTQQGLRQASIRTVTGTANTYEGDWHALFDAASIPTGPFNGRMLAWINQKLAATYTNLAEAEQALAAANGAANFSSLGTFDAALAPTNLASPLISGGQMVGATLTAYDGAWTGSPVITRRWLMDGAAVGTGATYTVQTADAGKVPSLEVTATRNGSSTIATVTRAAAMTEATANTTMTDALTAASLTAKLDVLHILAGSTRSIGEQNRLNPGTDNLSEVGTAATFVALKGFRSAASGSYLASIDPSGGTRNFKQNDHSWGLWTYDDVENTLAGAGWGNCLLNPKTNPRTIRARSSSSTTDGFTGAIDGRGLLVETRAASGTYDLDKNGDVFTPAVPKARTSAALTAGNFRVCGWGDGTLNHYDQTRYHSAFFMGKALTIAERKTLYDILGLRLSKCGAVEPEITRVMAGAVTSSGFQVAADVRFAFESGLQTRLVVTTDADTGFAAPVFCGDVQSVVAKGAHYPVKHTVTGLSAGVKYRYKIEVIRP